MSRPGIFNRLRSYIWHEQEPNPQVNITIEDTSEKVVVEQPVAPAASGPKVEGPNEELRSFFEANGDRELSKIEVLGVLNLISQAVARDESVLDLSNVSRSANSSAYPPQFTTSFSTSNIADLTGNRSIGGSRSRSRRPLASGPKRQSAKSLTRSQSSHGISIPKASAPVETKSRRPVLGKPRQASPADISSTATDFLGTFDEPMDDDTRPRAFEPKATSTLRAPLAASTPFKSAFQPASTPSTRPQKPVENLFASKPSSAVFGQKQQAQQAQQAVTAPLTKNSSVFTPKTADVASSDLYKSVFDPKPAATDKPVNGFGKAPEKAAAEKPAFTFGATSAPAVSKPAFGSAAPAPAADPAAAPAPFSFSAAGSSKPAFKAAVPAKDAKLVQTPKPFSSIGDGMDMDVDMDFDFPATVPATTSNGQGNGDEYMDEFNF